MINGLYRDHIGAVKGVIFLFADASIELVLSALQIQDAL